MIQTKLLHTVILLYFFSSINWEIIECLVLCVVFFFIFRAQCIFLSFGDDKLMREFV